MDLSGSETRVAYDNEQLYHNHSAWSFVPWHYLEGVINASINKKAKYNWQTHNGKREQFEQTSRKFELKYMLAIMNSTFAYQWLSTRSRSKMRFYPDDWKDFPIAIIPKDEQAPFIALVDAILDIFKQHGAKLPADAAQQVANLEQKIDQAVAKLYGVELKAK